MQIILEVAVELDLTIANTMFIKRDEHLITFKSRTNKTQIDYIAVRRRNRREVLDCKVIPGGPAVAQHRLLVADLRIKRKRKRMERRKGKVQIWKLKEQTTAERYKNEVLQRKMALTPDESADEAWKQMKEIVVEETEKVCGRRKHKNPSSREE